jgi:hypothetical protein
VELELLSLLGGSEGVRVRRSSMELRGDFCGNCKGRDSTPVKVGGRVRLRTDEGEEGEEKL